jgi:hypothetical protein
MLPQDDWVDGDILDRVIVLIRQSVRVDDSPAELQLEDEQRPGTRPDDRRPGLLGEPTFNESMTVTFSVRLIFARVFPLTDTKCPRLAVAAHVPNSSLKATATMFSSKSRI